MDYSALFTGVDLSGALTGILANPLIAGGITVVLGAVIAPTLIRILFKVFGRR